MFVNSPVIKGKESGLEKGKGSFQKSPFSRDSREFRDSREPSDCGKPRRVRPFSRDSREFRDFGDSRDSSSEKTPFVMTPFPVPKEAENMHTQSRPDALGTSLVVGGVYHRLVSSHT